MTPPWLDQFDVMAWDMPPDGYRQPGKYGYQKLSPQVLYNQYNKVCTVIWEAVSLGYKPTYSMGDLNRSYDLFAAQDGY